MFKRYRFFVALMVCLCVFSCGVIGTACAEATTFTKNTDCSETFFAALKAALTNPGDNENEVTIDVTNITGLKFESNKITPTMSDETTSPFNENATNVPITDITDLKGIEKFTALQTLDVSGCTNEGLKTLDVTALDKLTTLNVTNTALTWLKYYCDTKVTGYSLTVALRQVTLDGSINMAFYVPMTEANATNDSFTKTAAFSGGASGGTFRLDLVSKDASDNPTHYAFAGEVTSIQMADPITAEIHVGDKTVTFAGYTVKKYLNALNPTSNSNLDVLANAIKDYGYYAQVTLRDTNDSYGSHISMDKVSDIEVTSVTANTKIPITGQAVEASDPALSTYAINVTNGDKKNVSYTLDLDSKIALHVYLNSTIFPEGATIAAAVKKVNDTTNNETTTRTTYPENGMDVTPTQTTDGAYTVLSFNDIPAHEIDNKYTITISNGTTTTIEISPLSYVYAVLQLTYTDANKDSLKNDMEIDDEPELKRFKQAVIAFYNYYKATIAYRVNPNGMTEGTGGE